MSLLQHLLVPPSPTPRHFVVRLGSDPLRVAQLYADPTTQPMRIYQVFHARGGFVHNPEVLEDLNSKGFVTTEIKLTPDERAYFSKTVPETARAPQVWMVTCPGKVVQTGTGENTLAMACTVPGEVRSVSVSEARSTGVLSETDLELARYWAGRHVKGWRVYLPTVAGGGLEYREFQAAVRTVRAYDALAKKVEDLARAVVGGVPLDEQAKKVSGAALVFLAEAAQPVAELKEAHPDLFPAEARIGMAPAVAAALIHAGAVVISVIAICAFGYAAARYLAGESTRAYETFEDMRTECLRLSGPYLECAKDPARSFVERQQCLRAVKLLGCNDLPAPPDPSGNFSDMMKAAVPLAAIGAGLYLLGPVVREGAKVWGERIKARRQATAALVQQQG